MEAPIPLQKPRIVYADRGYDSRRYRRALRERGIRHQARDRKAPHRAR